MTQAQANADSAREKAARYEQLIAIKAISQQDYEDAQTADKSAAATLAVAKANAETAHINLNYTKVTAPISGRIGKSAVTPGALVTANQATPLATVQDLSKIYVDITQSASDLLRLKKQLASGALGAPNSGDGHADVSLTLDDGTAYNLNGRMEFSDVTVDPSTGSVTLRAVFANPNGLLLPGMYVRARIVKGTVAEGILIPQGAVILDPKGGASVLLAGADNKAHSQKVVAGDMVGSQWQILSGLKPGDKVITEGAMRLKDKAPIKPYPAKPAPRRRGAVDYAVTFFHRPADLRLGHRHRHHAGRPAVDHRPAHRAVSAHRPAPGHDQRQLSRRLGQDRRGFGDPGHRAEHDRARPSEIHDLAKLQRRRLGHPGLRGRHRSRLRPGPGAEPGPGGAAPPAAGRAGSRVARHQGHRLDPDGVRPLYRGRPRCRTPTSATGSPRT